MRIALIYIKMNLKKTKIKLYLALAIFFIANLFYYSMPAKAEKICTWYNTYDCTEYRTNRTDLFKGVSTDCAEKDKSATCGFLATCSCCCQNITSGSLNATMPNLKIPDIKLQVAIPGLNLTKGSAIKCTEQNGKKTCNIPWIGEYIAGIYKYAIGIVGILAAVVLMIGGVIWVVAGGSATMIGEAKAWIGASLTGLIIALCSYLILYQINPALTVFQPLQIAQVKKEVVPATGACQWSKGATCHSALGYGWKEGTECQGDKGENNLCCCVACVVNIPCKACNNCDDVSKYGLSCKYGSDPSGCLLNKDLASKLTNAGISNLSISEPWPPRGTHASGCHLEGTCADLSAPTSPADIIAMGRKLMDPVLGNLSNTTYEPAVTNPPFNCASIAPIPCNSNPQSTGAHFHVVK